MQQLPSLVAVKRQRVEPPGVHCMTYDALCDLDPMNPVSACQQYWPHRASVIISVPPWLEILLAIESVITAALQDIQAMSAHHVLLETALCN